MEPGKVYHVYNRGNNKQAIFINGENYIFFLKQFDKYLTTKLDVLAYCLMPNHFHLLVRIKIIEGISEPETSKLVIKTMRDFFISYSKAVNKKYNRSGALFQAKFKRKEVNSDFYFSRLVQYIHLNPVKAGFCKEPGGWKYSSYNAVISGKPTKVHVEEVIQWFGKLQEFIRVHKERVIDEASFKNFLFDE